MGVKKEKAPQKEKRPVAMPQAVKTRKTFDGA
jgi:hypothetical protein